MTSHRVRATLNRLVRESVYLLISWPLLVAAHVVLLTLIAAGIPLVIVWEARARPHIGRRGGRVLDVAGPRHPRRVSAVLAFLDRR
ncbi:glucose-6-phosphate dehydrogenase assembly protein OpcA [Kineosphaera limosa]|uniref:Uncharacterized protein n=1 Tax=Kineosphaera limosa NBRC 100340 TaxID=1184609 RepID=K6WPS4_9MICO|nr:hypothetical protein [Kineosphaera limosa]NYE00039.1 glucose-6-phosphate dehydrogenase assembly protein OpcA [Kineosphaera limosa]GAB95786.1 hypothetical protein KILIM_026_00570 [Kineosphaera limosa NBRC 100340]